MKSPANDGEGGGLRVSGEEEADFKSVVSVSQQQEAKAATNDFGAVLRCVSPCAFVPLNIITQLGVESCLLSR